VIATIYAGLTFPSPNAATAARIIAQTFRLSEFFWITRQICLLFTQATVSLLIPPAFFFQETSFPLAASVCMPAFRHNDINS